MAQTFRFGRRIALPSTRQIRHELLVLEAQENAKQRAADAGRQDVADHMTKIAAAETARSA